MDERELLRRENQRLREQISAFQERQKGDGGRVGDAFLKEPKRGVQEGLFKIDTVVNKTIIQALRAVLECDDLLVTLKIIFNAACRVTGAKSGFIALRGHADQRSFSLLEWKQIELSEQVTLPDSLVRAVTEHGAVCYNSFANSEWLTIFPQNNVKPQNIMFVPINLGDKLMGLMTLAGKKGDFSMEQTRVGNILGDLASVALRVDVCSKASRRQRVLADSLIRNCRSIVLVMDFDGRVVRVNPYMEKLIGYQLDEVRGKHWRSILRPNLEHNRFQRLFDETINESEVSGCIAPIVSLKDERRQVIWFTSTLKNDEDHVAEVLFLGTDITEQLQLEDRLKQSERLESIGHLAGGIAHDFNNMLSAIIGYTDMSMDLVETGSIIETNLQQILNAANRSKKLVRQILTFSRHVENGKKAIYLKPILEEALSLLRASIPSSVEICTEFQRESKAVWAEPTQIHELVMNLATNAVFALGKKGKLTVKLFEESVEDQLIGRMGKIDVGLYSVIEIADDGAGMSQNTLLHIFEPFYTTKPIGEGTGMGLAVVFGILKAHQGDIQVESALGRGSVFRVFLPKTEVTPRGVQKNPSAIPPGTERILFVDDEEILVSMAMEMLGAAGYDVVTALNGLEALELIRSDPHSIDLLITDQSMPKMTGIELAEQALLLRKDLPIILCTGYSRDVTPDTTAAVGVKTLITKPMSRDELGKVIRDILDGSRTS